MSFTILIVLFFRELRTDARVHRENAPGNGGGQADGGRAKARGQAAFATIARGRAQRAVERERQRFLRRFFHTRRVVHFGR